MTTTTSHPSLAVVVLNWNNAADTCACVASIRRSTAQCVVIVVDNGSTDNSATELNNSGADFVLCLDENLGYTGGNNAGLRIGLAQGYDVIAVLNNDTIVMPNALQALIDALSVAEMRAVSPDVRYVDPASQSWFAGGIVENGWPRHLQQHEIPARTSSARATDWLAGCCIAARSDTWRLVGGFDEQYFLICEDADWSMRARRRGVRLFVVDEAIIQHRIGRGFERAPSGLASFYFARNGLRFEWKYARRHLPRFIRDWLLRPAPDLLRTGRGHILLFGWMGAVAWLLGQGGPIPPLLERLAKRFD